MPDDRPSVQQIDEAGRRLRLALEGRIQGRLDGDAFSSAIDVVWGHRKSFTGPLAVAEAKLRPLVAEVAETADPPTGRPKRLVAIVDKLVRLRGMRLTQMEDIAGLRVVLPNGPTEVQALLGRIRNTWPDAKHKDYVTNPRGRDIERFTRL